MSDHGSLQEFLAAAVDAAKKAGQLIREKFYLTKHVVHKGEVDLVTETDKACEDLVFGHLKQRFPSHKFIGEETTAANGAVELTDEPTWIVDPIDGTTNFVHGFPFVCVSIGLTIGKVPTVGVVFNPIIDEFIGEETTAANGAVELTDEPTWIVDPIDGTTNFVHGFPFVCVSIGLTIGKVPTVGVVFNPIIDELFTGIRGQGAYLNGKAIKVSSQDELMKSLLAIEIAATRDKSYIDATTGRINKLLFKARSLRISGSCALSLCDIACGRIDLFYINGYGGPWDVAAGAVIVTEAGGLVYDPSGTQFDITATRVASSNPLLKEAFVEALAHP